MKITKEQILIGATVIATLSGLVSLGTNLSGAAAKVSEQVSSSQSAQMNNLQVRARNEINRRVKALNQVMVTLNKIDKLDSAQKEAFAEEIRQNIADLNSLNDKMNAENDMAALRSDVQSITGNYRIFALYIPKIHLLASTNVAAEIQGQLVTLRADLSARIEEEKTAGKDVTTLTADLADMDARIASIPTRVETINNMVLTLTPDGYPGNKTTLQSARSELQALRADISTAKQDAENIAAALKAMQ